MFKSCLITSAIICLLCASPAVFAADTSLEKVLTIPECAEGWSMEDKVTVYNRDTLFDRIDGEAEIYFPYGFEVLISARYVNKQNPQYAIEADIYKMGSLLDAFGMYANYRRADDGEIKIGAEGTINSSQLLFYQDRYFVRMQATGTLSIEQNIFHTCAQKISRNLPAGVGRPKELEAFVIPAVVRKSERYIAQSLLGYSFFPRGLMADAMMGSELVQVIIVPGDSQDAARKNFRRYQEYLQKSGSRVQLTTVLEGHSLEAVDPLYGNVFVVQYGRYLIGTVRFKEIAAAKQLVEQLRKRLDNQLR
jgi:hypothetical protein